MNRFFAAIPGGRKSVIALVLLIVALLGWQLWRINQFHIIKIDPALSRVAVISDSLTIYFSDDVDTSSFKLDDSYGIVSGKPVFRGKQVVVPISNLTKGVRYSLNITSVKNNSGDELIDQKLDFTAQNLSYSQLSKSQQKAIVAKQDQPTYTVSTLNYVNFDDLLENGITADQLQNVKQALFDYSNIVHKQFWTMTLVPASINVASYNPDASSTKNSAQFKVVLDQTTYTAKIEYDLLTDDVHLTLQNGSGAIVFDSDSV